MMFSVLLTLALAALTSSTALAAPTPAEPFNLDAGLARAAESERMMQEFLKEAMEATSNSTNPIFSRRDANGCLHTFHSFSNNQLQPGYAGTIGRTSPGPTGFRMFSGFDDESRMRYSFVFNDGSAPYTNIWVSMRGAPDSDRNSYASLREPFCVNNEGAHNCDEIDIVETYGGGNSRAEFAYYLGNGGGPTDPPRINNHFFPETTNNVFGHNFFTYKVYLERGNMVRSTLARADGLELESFTYTNSVPTKGMNLYLGIWPCHWQKGDTTEFCGQLNHADAWMEIGYIFYQTCNQ